MEWSFLPLSDVSLDQLKAFDCGDTDINNYLSESAFVCEEESMAYTFVMIHLGDTSKIAGYFTLSFSVIPFQETPDDFRVKQAQYAAPAILIGQFGIDKAWQEKTSNGTKISHILLFNALQRIVNLSKSDAAFRAIRIDTRNEKAYNFWKKFGFLPFKKSKTSLFLPIKVVKNLIA